jgi:hypothetical protein
LQTRGRPHENFLDGADEEEKSRPYFAPIHAEQFRLHGKMLSEQKRTGYDLRRFALCLGADLESWSIEYGIRP